MRSLLILQASGLVMLIIGIWMISQLHKYIDTQSPIVSTLPIVFLSLAASILILAALACCCTAKGKVPLLYLVRSIQSKALKKLSPHAALARQDSGVLMGKTFLSIADFLLKT